MNDPLTASVISQGLPILSHALMSVGYFKYPLLFLGAIVEGPIVTIASGFLLHSGVFHFWPLYLSLAAGDLLGDAIWYGVGRFFAGPALERHGRFLTLTPEIFEKIKKRFHKNHSLILFTSKIMMGFGMALATLTAAGAAKIPFRSFMFWNALGEVIYVAILLSLGYFFGHLYGFIATGVKTLFIFTSSVVTIAALYLLANYLRRKVSK